MLAFVIDPIYGWIKKMDRRMDEWTGGHVNGLIDLSPQFFFMDTISG